MDRPQVAADRAWRRAAAARARAATAADAAERLALVERQNGTDRFKDLIARQRRAVDHHLTAAEMQETYARQMIDWSPARDSIRPRFMSSVVAACGADGGALVLLDNNLQQLAVTSSDPRAAQAQDLEYVLGEGPMYEASRHGCAVAAVGSGLEARWPQYGRSVMDLGLRAAAAIPLTSERWRFGVMAVFAGDGLPITVFVAPQRGDRPSELA
ncbi:GAF domain-containing protein [Streptomyces sp. NPDC059900]|uniref:GAF domain-containing protein n=1 Tax=Streptomyces sp. NPDC059900 TaxID=3155816 RepID=UPI00341F973B